MKNEVFSSNYFSKMKVCILLLFFFCLFSSCQINKATITNWFPSVENLYPFDEYMNNFRIDDINVARNAYRIVLEFIEKVIDASHENLEKAHAMDEPTVKRAILVYGEFDIIEDSNVTLVHKVWNSDRMDYEEAATIDFIREYVLIINHSNLHNILIYHWYYLTGELLGEYIDISAVSDKFFYDHKRLLIAGGWKKIEVLRD